MMYNLVVTFKDEEDPEGEMADMLRKAGYDMAIIELAESGNSLLVHVPENPRRAVVKILDICKAEGSDFLDRYRLIPIMLNVREIVTLADINP